MREPFEPILSPIELYETLITFIHDKLPIFILGDPGQGKTEITRQAAAACKADFVPIFLAIKDPASALPGIGVLHCPFHCPSSRLLKNPCIQDAMSQKCRGRFSVYPK